MTVSTCEVLITLYYYFLLIDAVFVSNLIQISAAAGAIDDAYWLNRAIWRDACNVHITAFCTSDNGFLCLVFILTHTTLQIIGFPMIVPPKNIGYRNGF